MKDLRELNFKMKLTETEKSVLKKMYKKGYWGVGRNIYNQLLWQNEEKIVIDLDDDLFHFIPRCFMFSIKQLIELNIEGLLK